jgi:hypothetical protein
MNEKSPDVQTAQPAAADPNTQFLDRLGSMLGESKDKKKEPKKVCLLLLFRVT